MNERLTSLDCRTCAAPLQLRGGHQVKTITCGYCGTVMDVHDEFRVLAQYQDVQRPFTPLEIGMTGTIHDVEFTVIGTVQYGYRDEWGDYSWVSSQLFSPTHGYAWLTWNDGHFIFSRRVRDLPIPPAPLGITPKKTKATFRDRSMRLYERFTANVQFVEGELTWQAALGDTVKVDEYIDPPFGLEYERSHGELEYSRSEYIEPEIIADSFDLGELPKRGKMHAIQPFIASNLSKAVSSASYVFLIIAAAGLIITAILGYGNLIGEKQIALTPGSTHQVPFSFSRPDHLLFVKVNTGLKNSWTYVEAAILDENEEPVAALGREISYYYGSDWSEGSQDTNATVKLPQPGNYLLEIEVDPESPNSPLVAEVKIWEGYMPWRYFSGLLGIFLIGLVSLPIRRLVFEHRRWAEVIEDDDD